MESAPRYEILDTLATGDFAAVYRARDRELGREVAVKQIHAQFLADPRQLARYWQEAQLLASLQHPNIVTIYDVVRSRGWLILELMRGSLKQATQGRPIDLELLRSVLIGCLQGLHFLHSNGVIHGDVKPGNILIGAQNRVKLGDFGLARRASNEEGSLLKGTTKYMAPELLSPQFGTVGPASDLYSLGFSAYELICGAQFESLLPGLSTFGRDKQIAWMMWHSAADMRLPEIQRVLEGVPEDLAHVVQKLIVKDQSRRYKSAVEVLRDLQKGRPGAEPLPDEPDSEAEAARIAAARKRRRLRIAVIAAGVVAMVLAAGMFFLPKKQEPRPKASPTAVHGVVTNVYPDEMKFAITVSEDGTAKAVSFGRHDRLFINDEPRLLRELKEHDNVVIEKVYDDHTDQRISEIRAFRPKMDQGRIALVKADEGRFVLTIEVGEDQGKPLVVNVPAELNLVFNGKPQFQGRPARLADLLAGDRAIVHHVGDESGRKATEVDVERVVEMQGMLAEDYDARSGKLSIVTGQGTAQRVQKLPFAAQYVITVNGQPAAKPTALKRNDQVVVQHDRQIVGVKAQRTLDAAGVIEQIRYEAPQTLSVLGDDGQKMTCLVGPACQITLGGESVALDDLRPGDKVLVGHGSLDAKRLDTLAALSIKASRAADAARWAIVIATQDYDDRTLAPLNYPAADARLLADVLVKRYQVPVEQLLLLVDESLVRLEQGIGERLNQIGPEAKLIVYYVGHAYKDDQGAVYLAPKNFDLKRISLTGLPLQKLVDQVEECAAKEKLLLLDACHGSQGADLALEPSSSEMLQTLKAPPGRAPLRTVVAMASCRAGQRNLVLPAKGHGLFAWSLIEAYSGRADTNHDNRLEPTELFGYLQQAMVRGSAELGSVEVPELFLPNNRPPRLSEEAKQSIRRLNNYLSQTRVDPDAVAHEYVLAYKLAKKEIEPRLLYGLVLVKMRDREGGLRQFGELKSEHPELLIPLQAIVWLRFEKRIYPAAMNDLVELVNRIPKPKPGQPYPAEHQELFGWIGQLAGFANAVYQEPSRSFTDALTNLETAVAGHEPAAVALFKKGRQRSESIAASFDERIETAEDEATAKLLKVERRLLARYADFPAIRLAQQVLAHLDD